MLLIHLDWESQPQEEKRWPDQIFPHSLRPRQANGKLSVPFTLVLDVRHCGWTHPACCNNNNNILLSVGSQCWSLGADQEGNQNPSIQSRPAGFISTHHQLKPVCLSDWECVKLFAYMQFIYLLFYLFTYVFIYLSVYLLSCFSTQQLIGWLCWFLALSKMKYFLKDFLHVTSHVIANKKWCKWKYSYFCFLFLWHKQREYRFSF